MSKNGNEPDDAPVPGAIAAARNAEPAAEPQERRRGRPIKLTPEVAKTICDTVRGGAFLTRAAKAAGISLDALAKWRERGEQGEEPFAKFVEDLEQAELECEQWHVENWRQQAPNDWRASKEFLAKRHPERWSDHAGRLAVLGPESGREGFTFNILLNLGDTTVKFSTNLTPAEPPIEVKDVNELPPPGETRN